MKAASSSAVFQQTAHCVAPTYARFPVAFEDCDGAWLLDPEGRRYLDFGSGLAVSSLGHGHPALAEVLRTQGTRPWHLSNLYHVPAQAALAQRLIDIVGTPGKIFFCNSGAEANEALIKLARRYGNTTAPGRRHTILTFHNSFHGRTLAGIAATGQEKVRSGFDPVTPGFRHLPFNDLAAVEAAIDGSVVAILLETIQGEGGIHPVDPDFLRGLRRLCDQHDLLLLLDEVQCGLGRTGDWCAWKSIGAADVVPDAVGWAKGIAGGFPLAAVWFSGKRTVQPANSANAANTTHTAPFPLSDLLGPGSHGTTFGGGPLGCAVALKVLDIIQQDDLLSNARQRGTALMEGLHALQSPMIQAIRGRGLMIGIELNPDVVQAFFPTEPILPPARILTEAALQAGLLVIPSLPNTIRLLPALTIGYTEVRACLDILQQLLLPQSVAEPLAVG